MINTLAFAKQVAARNFENLQRVQTGTFLSALDAQKNRFLLYVCSLLSPLAFPSGYGSAPAPSWLPEAAEPQPQGAARGGAPAPMGGGVSFAANLQESCKGPQIQSCFLLLYLLNMALEIVLWA